MTPGDRSRRIVETIAAHYGVTAAGIRGSRRGAPLIEARQAAHSALWIETTMSLPQIGRMLNRDHTTILHSIRRTGAWPERRWPSSLREVKSAVYKDAL